MRKALIVANVLGFISNFEIQDIKILQEKGYEVHCATNCAYTHQKYIDNVTKSSVTIHNVCFSRNPIAYDNYLAYKELLRIVQENNFDLIHCHTPIGGIIGRIVANKMKTPCIIYTAHGFHFYKKSPKINWIIYYPIEWFLAHITDILITINKQDYDIAVRHFKHCKVCYIPGIGVDVKKFNNINFDHVEKRKKLHICKDDFVILSVGELNKNKNHILAIKSIAKLIEDGYSNIKYIICGEGELKDELISAICQYGYEDNIRLLGFREDIAELYEIADLYILPSLQEELPITLMEAMASSLPCIGTNIQEINELINNNKNGYLIDLDANSIEVMSLKIRKIMINKNRQKSFALNSREIIEKYDKKIVNDIMNQVYSINSKSYKGINEHLSRLIMKHKIREKYSIPFDSFVLLSVGELNNNKNHIAIIEALYKVNLPNIYYIICGEGPLRGYLEKKAQELMMSKRIIFAGFVNNVIPYYYSSDVFVFPSKREGLGMAALEALSCGIPILSSDSGGINDYVYQEKTGLKCKYNDINQFTKHIMLFNDSTYRSSYLYRCEEEARKFDINVVREKMNAIYDEASHLK